MRAESLCRLACGVVLVAIGWALVVCALAWKGGRKC